MTNLSKIITISISALLTLITGCKRTDIDHSDSDKRALLFSAESAEDMGESTTKATRPLSDFHTDFGVWGIARNDKAEQLPYILWSENALIEAELNSSSGAFEPVSGAYWFSDHTYHFIAVAPFQTGTTGVNVITKEEDETANGDKLVFTYSMESNYADKNYTFDLMGAVAMSEVDVAATHPSSQPITFKHLFSRININIYFKDENGNSSQGSVQGMRLRKVSTKGEYEITFAQNETDGTYSIPDITCIADPTENYQEITFYESSLTTNRGTLHILPQDVSGFELYLDFTIGSGADALTLTDFKVNLSTANIPTYYNYTESRNWNITIGPKASISFSVEVTPWENTIVGDGEDNDENQEIEIC